MNWRGYRPSLIQISAKRQSRAAFDLTQTCTSSSRSGAPEGLAMKLSGQKTRSVFDRYNVVSEGDLRDAAHRLGRISPSVAVFGNANPQNS